MFLFKKINKDQSIEKNPAKKNHRRIYILAILLVLILIAVAVIYRFSQKPAEGVIKSSPESDKIIQPSSDVPESFVGKYVSFMYSNKYVLKSHEISQDSADVILETAYLSETGAISNKINLTVRSLPSGNLEDNPDYKMREIETKRYKKGDFPSGELSGQSFIPNDERQFEKTFFIQKDGLLAIISVASAAFFDETLNKEANAIAKSLEWSSK